MTRNARYAGGLCAILGLIGLLGWAFESVLMKSVIPGFATMKVNTALLFLLSGFALFLLSLNTSLQLQILSVIKTSTVIALASATVAVALASIVQDIVHTDLGIDDLLRLDDSGGKPVDQQRMPVSGSIQFALAGLSTVLLLREKTVRLSQKMAIVIATMSLVTLVGYIYVVDSIFDVTIYSSMAVHSVVGFLILSFGLFYARSDVGHAATLVGDTMQGVMLRRMLPYAVAIPIIFGWLALWGERRGFFSGDLGQVLLVLSSLVVLCGAIGWTAKSIAILENKRLEAAESLRKSEERYRSTLENLMEGCQILGPDWKYRYLNETSAQHGNRSREELIGRSITEMYPGIEDTEVFTRMRVCMEKREPHRMENRFDYADGSSRWFRLSIEPVPEGIFVLSADITEEKNLLQELDAHRRDLEGIVHKRTEELRRTNEELEAFTYSVSHDLRAPLRHIDGFASLLRKRIEKGLDEKSIHYLDTISGSARQMGELIDGLLVLSRMGRVELHRSEIPMQAMVSNLVRAISEDLNHLKIEWTLDALAPVDADPSMMRLVWQNLLENAVKYSRQRDPIRVWVGTQLREAERIFFVRDNGVGFNMQYADKLFGVFQRLHREEEFEGTGIGLANVKRIVSRHGGRVWAESEPDKGATFYFSLPAMTEGDGAHGNGT